jgi:hypothetical protein
VNTAGHGDIVRMYFVNVRGSAICLLKSRLKVVHTANIYAWSGVTPGGGRSNVVRLEQPFALVKGSAGPVVDVFAQKLGNPSRSF